MKRLTVILIVAAIAVVNAYASKPGCIKSSHHYEGHPKPHTYVITVLNNCDQKRIVTVKIMDAITLAVLKKEEFPLMVGETRWVKYSFVGEKLLFYSVDSREE